MNEKHPLSLADKVTAVLMAAIVAVMLTQVGFRYVLNQSLSWSEELLRFLFIWLVFLGAALNVRDNWDIGVDFLAGLFPGSFTRLLRRFDLLAVMAFLLFLSVSGCIWAFYSRGSYSSALGMPLYLVLYGALPVSSLLACYYCLRRIRGFSREQKERSKR